MGNLRRTLLRLLNVFGRGLPERELTREVDAHLDALQRQFQQRGLSSQDARDAARRAFGGIEQVKELQRDARSFRWMDDLRRDIVYGVRTLFKTRGFTITATLTLALGISAVTVIYSLVRNVVLNPFPYSRSDRLVNVVLRDGSGRQLRGPYFPSAEFLDYQTQATAFEDVVGSSRDTMLWQGDNGTERFSIVWMTPNGFDFLGVKPMLGRVFEATDAAPGAAPVAVMCHRAWVRLFGADPGVIGRTLVLDGTAWTVIGVMPPRFEWNIADLWLPATMNPNDDPRSPRGNRAFQAHLRPGVSAREAEAQLNVIGARRARVYPDQYPEHAHFEVVKVVDWVVQGFRAVLYTLFGAVSLLLVIACCNVANMLLARATSRERVIAIRTAIGASRGRRRTTVGRRQTRMRSSLVIAQVALSIVLLVGAGLLMRTFVKLVGVNLGFDPKNVLVTAIALPPHQSVSADAQLTLYRQVIDRVATVPSVVSVAITNGFPPFGGLSSAVEISGVSTDRTSQSLVVFGSERLLETLGIPIVKGRGLSTIDIEQSHPVAVINETLARRYFGTEDPLTQRIRLPRLVTLPRPISNPSFQIIGVVRDVATAGPGQHPAPEVLLPLSLRLPAGAALLVRTTDDPLRVVNAVRREIQVIDPLAVLVDPVTLERSIQMSFYLRPGFSFLVLGIFAATGAFLVALGIYGVLAYTVSQQTREIAIRIALGGESGHVVRMIVRFGLQLVGAGLVIGVAISFATNRLLTAQLWNTSPNDPMTFVLVILLMITIGVLACWIPARRAVRVQPMIALRHD